MHSIKYIFVLRMYLQHVLLEVYCLSEHIKPGLKPNDKLLFARQGPMICGISSANVSCV
jgi:hypothetical protein